MPGRARRIICRASFLTFCLLPTLALAGWIINERAIEGAASPAVEARAKPLAEAELARLLGLQVTLERIAYPETGYTLLEGVTLANPETGARIAYIPALEMARGPQGLVLVATRPEIDADHWSALWETLHERVLRERGERLSPMQMTARQLTLVSQRPGRSPTFTDLEVRLESGQAAIDFRLAGVDMPNRAQFKARRDRTATTPTTRWELHTGEAAFPCVLFADHVPWLAHLGERCLFTGSLWCEEAADGWRGELGGHFTQIDLDRLITDQFPHKLSGDARATLTRAEFHAGRIRRAAGHLESGPGVISRGLLASAVDQLGLRYTDQLPEAVAPLTRYGQLSVGFNLDEAGLRLSGNCDPEGTMLALEANSEARVLDHHLHLTPSVSLVRMLAPASEVQVSAAQETEALLRVLPLPSIKRPEPPSTDLPEARARPLQ